ncbi:hypothetical protein S7335_1074 [Synechococcus sp. PCC 7335]|nr:hypothetical protein S7335_1074 [Synechococcus sp. PCC 7335]
MLSSRWEQLRLQASRAQLGLVVIGSRQRKVPESPRTAS